MENQNIRVSTQWEHSLTNLLGHDPTSDPGIALRQWVHFQGVENILDLLSWEEDELKAIPAQQVFNLDDHGQGSYLRINQTKQICGLITYMKHIFKDFNSGMEVRTDPFHPFLPEEWNQHTSTMMRTFLVQHLPTPIGPQLITSGPIPSSKPTAYSPAALELIQFPPEMDENWVRYGLAKLGQISKLPNWQRMLFCAYTTQLLHSTVEVCWNNNDSYFIWFEFVCRNSGQIASRRSWKRSCLGLEYTSKCSRLALLWEPN